MKNDHNNNNSWINYYSKREISPALLWSLGLTSIITLFLLYSPSPLLLTSIHARVPLSNHTTPVEPQKHYVVDDDQCDLFTGKWVHELNVSQYTSSSCKTIPATKNCFQFGRKDTDFLNWRWKPNGCDLPRFDANKFLQIVQGKKMAFIGDSLARNHFESLVCLLSQVETPTNLYTDSEDRFKYWHFPSYDFTLMVFWSRFLVQEEEIMVNNIGTGSFNLQLDKVDMNWASKIPGVDYTIISTGHWFFGKDYLYNKNKLVGCVYCNDPNVKTFGPNYSIRMAMRQALQYINDCKECKGMLTFVRTYSPSHFENGGWNSGGTCNKTSPYSEEMVKETSFDLVVSEGQKDEFERASIESDVTGKRFSLVDVTPAMLMRPDGHPCEYYKWSHGAKDCVHWCMPGPIDMWSDLLLAVMQKEVGVVN